MHKFARIEWPTVLLFVATYALWAWATGWLAATALWPSIAVTTVLIAFQSSLQHEATHDHPTGWRFANTALAWPPLTLVIPWLRFRDTHLDHHHDATLTDPHDDPESNFMDPADWARLSRPARGLRLVNNTLAGRVLIGPLIGTACFIRGDLSSMRTDPRVRRGWLWHIPAVAAVIAWLWASPMPLWAYAVSAYAALGLLRIRTFLEHQAHENARGRSVIIEDRGPLAFLFLNNNLHAVHHAHPGIAWYRLPAFYRRHRDRFLAMNGGYRYSSYKDVFRAYFFRRKDPIAHPLR